MPNTSLRLLPLAMLSTLFIGCGGGGSDGDTSTRAPAQPVKVVDTVVKEVLVAPEPIKVNNDSVPPNLVPPDLVTPDLVTPTPEPISTPTDVSNIKVVFDKLNKRRTECGFGALKVSQHLTDAATNHGKYLLYAAENSDKKFSGHKETRQPVNPYFSGEGLGERINTNASTIGNEAKSVTYPYKVLTESLSYNLYPDTYLNYYTDNDIALGAINGLLSAPYHLADLVDPDFSQVGIYYGRGKAQKLLYQGSVLELVLGRPANDGDVVPQNTVLSYPCEGTDGTAYALTNETPNPFGDSRDLKTNPIGQPIYIMAHGAITVSESTLTDSANTPVKLQMLTAANDPAGKLKDNQVFLMPLSPLTPNQWYKVTYKVSVNGGAKQSKAFNFKTKAANPS